MNPTRREFMRQVGVTLAGLLMSSCAPHCYTVVTVVAGTPHCYTVVTVVAGTPRVNGTPESPRIRRWRELRTCWLALKDSRLQSPGDTGFSQNLRQRHKDSLYALIASKDLSADVAGEIAVAFDQALAHIQRQAAACCYEPLPPEYRPRENLMSQAAALTEMAGRSSIDSDTVARAQAALERDTAWLAQFQGGQSPGELSSIEATPAEVEAARVLVELLLERK